MVMVSTELRRSLKSFCYEHMLKTTLRTCAIVVKLFFSGQPDFYRNQTMVKPYLMTAEPCRTRMGDKCRGEENRQVDLEQGSTGKYCRQRQCTITDRKFRIEKQLGNRQIGEHRCPAGDGHFSR
jgi:hypothetical protein